MLALQQYGSSDEDHEDEIENSQENDSSDAIHLKPVENEEFSVKSQLQICAAPLVVPTVSFHIITNTYSMLA